MLDDILSVKSIQNFKNSIRGGIFMNISFSPKHQMGSINLNYPSNAKTLLTIETLKNRILLTKVIYPHHLKEIPEKMIY